jgi:hypothetical protein
MSFSYDELKSVRDSFNAFRNKKVFKRYKDLEEKDNLDYAEVVSLIKDRKLQSEYCKKVIELLEANLKYEEPDEKLIQIPKISNFKVSLFSIICASLVSIKFGAFYGVLFGVIANWILYKEANTLSASDIAHNEIAKDTRIMCDDYRESIRRLKSKTL